MNTVGEVMDKIRDVDNLILAMLSKSNDQETITIAIKFLHEYIELLKAKKCS